MGAEDPSRGWQPPTALSEADAMTALDEAIVRVRFSPQNLELRRRLRAIATLPSLGDRAVALLGDAVGSTLCDEPIAAAALLEVLVHTLETFDRPVEAVTAAEQLVALAPDNVQNLLGLANRCVALGAWLKAAEAFERIGAVGTREQAAMALRSAAKLYVDNSQPARALDSYRALVSRRPNDADAWHELEGVLERLERWHELAEVRGQRAQHAATPVDKARALRGQARALEMAGELAAASAAMAEATRFVPDNVSGLLDYTEVLVRTGKPHEAAELLAKRIDEAIARGSSADEIAELRLRHAGLLEEASGDRPTVIAALDRLLADHPSYLPALERLVWHASHDPDPRVHAAALERYASAIPEPAARANLYVEAARTYRDARDGAAAARLFQHAIELAPDEPGLHAELEAVRALLEVERATADAAGGDVERAQHRLRELLAARPYDVEANLALARLLAMRDRDAARAHLQSTLAAADADLAKSGLAPLALEYALLVDATGDHDEAHRLLQEAHLLDRSSLRITLALGQSCIRRKLWRQAILHLAPLAEHPEAPRHAARVAEGLVQAGQAEVRALRPANARKHYEAALRLDPACPSAWHELGADALEHGDLARAVECFEREAKGTTSAADRGRLFDVLGDIAHDKLGDPARAEAYWAQIADPDAAVLRKLLAVQRARGAELERAETCMRLAALEPAESKPLLVEAAELFAACGDFVRGRAAAERLIAEHPLDIDAVGCASGVVLAACDADTAATWLERALESRSVGKQREPRLAELWRRLGDTERSRDRKTEARTAYERAVLIAPTSPDGIAARRALIDLVPRSARTLDALEMLVEAEQSPDEVIALARAFVAAERLDDARTVVDLARAIGLELSDDDARLGDAAASKPLAYDEAYGGTLDEDARYAAIDDAADEPLGSVLAALGESISLLARDATTALRNAGLGDAARLSVTSYAIVAAMYPQVSKALGGPATLLFTSEQVATGLRVVLASPPAIVVGADLAAIRSIEDPATDPMLRFELGRVVELVRPRRLLATGVDRDAFVRFVDGLWQAFGPGGDPTRDDEAKRIHAALPVPLRRKITELIAELPRDAVDPDAYLAACERAADRSGLVACGNATVAIARAPHLQSFAASRAYRSARQRLHRRTR
ncbi:MAG TPA: tetratricopeptide repeat protein [Kofleriaceae bacterium]|nr:tetratricopeptide repeat protein [Kofleriaceae bacterium]